MAVRLASSGGNVADPAVINVYASGVVQRNSVVDFSRTGGSGVTPASSSSTVTTIFGVCLDYAQGASDTLVRVIPFAPGQIWEIDNVNTLNTGQIGLRHALDSNLNLRGTNTDVTGATGVFFAINVDGSTTGSGKVLGVFRGGAANAIPTLSTSTVSSF